MAMVLARKREPRNAHIEDVCLLGLRATNYRMDPDSQHKHDAQGNDLPTTE